VVIDAILWVPGGCESPNESSDSWSSPEATGTFCTAGLPTFDDHPLGVEFCDEGQSLDHDQRRVPLALAPRVDPGPTPAVAEVVPSVDDSSSEVTEPDHRAMNGSTALRTRTCPETAR